MGPAMHTEFGNSIALGHSLFGKLAGYVEFFSDVSTERGARWVGTFGMGLIYELTTNIQTGRRSEHRNRAFGGRLCHPFLGLT